jgi:uncharacterized protein YcbK (DUF882 family)
MNVIESEQKAPGAFHRWTQLPAIMVALLCMCATSALAETRSLKIQHLHTGEKAEIVFKRNGRYDQAGLKKINIMLRDWRRNEPTRMDPRLLDLVWQAYRASGSTGYINVVSGYRSPTTNAMLRSRSKGVARESQHMVGRAMDFFLPDVPLKKLRDIGLKMQGGGVGYYPTSGSPFIHMDVGNVRHWPGISRQELARVFPNGKTLHVPSDGKPLPGYEQALAAYKSRRDAGTPNIELASAGDSQRKPRGLLASLLGGRDKDETSDIASAVPAPRKPAKSVEPTQVRQEIAIVAPQDAQRANIPVASEKPAEEPLAERKPETPASIVAALAPQAVPLPAFAQRHEPAAHIPTPETVPFAMANVAAARTEVAAAKPLATDTAVGKAQAIPPSAAPQIVALNIPVPNWRPENQPSARQPEAARSGDAIAALLATNRPDERADRLAAKPIATPIPEARDLPEARDRVMTSPKADRLRPDAPAVVMQASYQPSRSDRGITGAIASAAEPRNAARLILAVPEQVYVDGFRSDREPSDHRRFTGSAVKFLPIASFK